MLNVSEPFQQEVLHENEQIYQRISNELRKSRSQVLVAIAWFTDNDLFQILLDLLERDVDVRIILADNDDNKKLDFGKLQRKGAIVHKVKQSGYGGMRKRFCVIDKRIAIHGSYNWSINARLKNQESVIVTTHSETIVSLTEQFNEMEQEAITGNKEDKGWRTFFHRKNNQQQDNTDNEAEPEDQTTVTAPTEEEPSVKKTSVTLSTINFQAEYANVLDGMIAAEICNFDRDILRSQGYERARASNGDAQILSNAMDTVYSVFINDINVVEDKKRRLIGKISEQKTIYSGALEGNHQIQLRTIEAETESARQETVVRLSELKTKVSVYEADIDSVKNQKIIAAQTTEKEIEARIKEIEQECIVTKFKWYEFIPVALFSLGLLFYLFLFYSSAVYIMLFSERDAKRAQMAGEFFDPPHVFEPKALSHLFREDGYAISFVFLFVFIPLAVAIIGKFVNKGFFSKVWTMLLTAILLDAGIAYKVSYAIYEAGYMSGNVTERWRYTMALLDTNFYLVFLLGSLGLFIFHALFGKLISLFEERNPDIRSLQLKQKRGQEKDDLDKQRNYIATLNESVEIFGKELIKVKNEVHIMEVELAGLPHKKAISQENAVRDFENNRKVLNDVTIIYTSRIENDVLPISVDSIKDRINVFLEGWTSFLNDHYAETKAAERVRLALDAAIAWQQEKLAGNQMDNRLKKIP